MLPSSIKQELTNCGLSILISADEDLLENVKPNLISTSSTDSCSSHLHSGIKSFNSHELQSDEEIIHKRSEDAKELESSLDSFTVILEEPSIIVSNSRSVSETDIFIKHKNVNDLNALTVMPKQHSVTTPDLLEKCSSLCNGQGNRAETTMLEMARDSKRKWSSVQDLSKSSYSPHKNNTDILYPVPFTGHSSTTISSVPRSKDSGFQRSVSCLSLNSVSKPYDHVQSKVRDYIKQIKRTESERKKNARVQNGKCESRDRADNSSPYEPSENLQEIVKILKQELSDKENMISQIQENYDALLMKYAEAENRIDRLRFKVIDSSVEEIPSSDQQTGFNFRSSIHSKDSFCNRSTTSLKIGHRESNSPLFKNIFPSSLPARGSSLPVTTNRENSDTRGYGENFYESRVGHLKSGNSFLSPIKHSAIHPLAFSTPNNSFSTCISPRIAGLGIKEINAQRVSEHCEVRSSVDSEALSKSLDMMYEEYEFIPMDLENEMPKFEKTIPVNIRDHVRSGDKDTIDHICKFSSNNPVAVGVKSSISAELPANVIQDPSVSEKSVLKVMEWQNSLPPFEEMDSRYMETMKIGFDSARGTKSQRNSPFCEKEKTLVNSDCGKRLCCKNEYGKILSKGFYPRENLQAQLTVADNSVCYESSNQPKNQQHCFNSPLTSKSLTKPLPPNDKLSSSRFYSRSEPDLRKHFSLTLRNGNSVVSPTENIHVTSNCKTDTNTSDHISCAVGCIHPLIIEPCDCWEKKSTVTEEPAHRLAESCSNSFLAKEQISMLDCTVPRLKLGELLDVSEGSTDSVNWQENVASGRKSNIAYSPSTSVSSAALYSANKFGTKVQHLRNSDDTSTSYKNIKRREASVEEMRCIAPTHLCRENTVNNISTCCQPVNCNCKNDRGCHSAAVGRQYYCRRCRMGVCRKLASCRAANELSDCSCIHSVPTHSCGVNTDHVESLSPFLSRDVLHKFSSPNSTHSCGVNTDLMDCSKPYEPRIEILTNENVIYRNHKNKYEQQKCVNINESPVVKNHNSVQIVSQDSKTANNLSVDHVQASSVTGAEDSVNLARCLEEVNHIANLLKAQSENIIEVVTTKLRNDIKNGNLAVDVPDVTY